MSCCSNRCCYYRSRTHAVCAFVTEMMSFYFPMMRLISFSSSMHFLHHLVCFVYLCHDGHGMLTYYFYLYHRFFYENRRACFLNNFLGFWICLAWLPNWNHVFYPETLVCCEDFARLFRQGDPFVYHGNENDFLVYQQLC